MSLLEEIDAEVHQARLDKAVAARDTPPIFDWLLNTFSYQGISDRVAREYMEKHGTASWSDIQASLRNKPSCPKLRNYWSFDRCRYDKTSFTCSEPEHIDACPVPRPYLRNGRLNQTSFSLFLFVRDLMDGDIVHWIDTQLAAARSTSGTTLAFARQEALIGPLRNIYGVSDKVLMMTLSTLLIGAREHRLAWFETGAAMIAIDTLVHNFLHRTGILQGCGIPHAYGTACYSSGGCAGIIRTVSDRIDVRTFNRSFPQTFPRFVQHAIWRFCAADGQNLCNGHRIDDRQPCQVSYCQLHHKCSREPLNRPKTGV
jgi:hypothetical protein